jgi:hypothetical protein
MSGAIPPLPQYVSMAWYPVKKQILQIFGVMDLASVIPESCFCGNIFKNHFVECVFCKGDLPHI